MAPIGYLFYGISLVLFTLALMFGFLLLFIIEDRDVRQFFRSWLRCIHFTFLSCSLITWLLLFVLVWLPKANWLIIILSTVFLVVSAFSLWKLMLLLKKPISGQSKTAFAIWFGTFSIFLASSIGMQFLLRVMLI